MAYNIQLPENVLFQGLQGTNYIPKILLYRSNPLRFTITRVSKTCFFLKDSPQSLCMTESLGNILQRLGAQNYRVDSGSKCLPPEFLEITRQDDLQNDLVIRSNSTVRKAILLREIPVTITSCQRAHEHIAINTAAWQTVRHQQLRPRFRDHGWLVGSLEGWPELMEAKRCRTC